MDVELSAEPYAELWPNDRTEAMISRIQMQSHSQLKNLSIVTRLANKQTIQTINLGFGWLDILKLQACLFRLVN